MQPATISFKVLPHVVWSPIPPVLFPPPSSANDRAGRLMGAFYLFCISLPYLERLSPIIFSAELSFHGSPLTPFLSFPPPQRRMTSFSQTPKCFDLGRALLFFQAFYLDPPLGQSIMSLGRTPFSSTCLALLHRRPMPLSE